MYLSAERLAIAREEIARGEQTSGVVAWEAHLLRKSSDVDVSMYTNIELCNIVRDEIWTDIARSLETEETIDIEKYHVHLLERVQAVTRERVIAEREHHDCSAEVRDVREKEMQARLALFRVERNILQIADKLTGGIHVLV